ncbi:MAG: synthase delta subunit [Candidatus Parcubacteria bacterium]|jgi:F0F1-type ATP synthase delta subunit
MKNNYIKAVIAELEKGSSVDVVLANLKKVLTKKGHLSIHGDILRGLQAELSRTTAKSEAVVFVANEADTQKFGSAIKAALVTMGEAGVATQTVVDKTLIGGFKVNHNGKMFDASYKSKLTALYRNVTS